MKPKDKYQSHIELLLRDKKFLAGREIVNSLQKQFKISSPNARKILQRTTLSGLIISSKPLSFGKGQFIYMLPNSVPDLHVIKDICKIYRPPLYRIIDVLEENDGVLSYYEALKVSASIDENSSTKANTVDELIYILVELGLAKMEEDENNVRYIVDKNLENPIVAMSNHYSKMVLDSMFIPDMLRWLRSVNVIDNIKTVYRNKQTPSKGAIHNNLIWDAFAYTKTTGINDVLGKKANTVEKQTLVVLDVVIARQYGASDLDGFLARIQVNINSVRQWKRKVMPIVIYKEASERVQNTIASLGLLSFDIGSIFGSRIYEIVKKVNNIQIKKELFEGEDLQREISEILLTIRKVGQEHNLQNLMGVFFEYLLSPVIKSIFPDSAILHGKTLSEKVNGIKEQYEYDFIVQSEYPKEIVVIEVKGYASDATIGVGDTNSKNTLIWFFGKTLPFLKKQYSKQLSEGYRLKASYITTAGFYENGIKYLATQSKFKSKKLETHYDGKRLLQLLSDNDFTHVIKTIERYYIKKEI